MSSNVRARSLFDPQYYLPNSPKAKLASYSFFPEQVSGGFSTNNFALVALESAAQCISFQIAQNFEALVIPARFMEQMESKYFEKQEEYTVVPFLKAIAAANVSKPVYLTLPLTSAMLLDSGFRVSLLNWVTGFPEIHGVYILVSDDRTSKQIRSQDLLFSYLCFAHELRTVGLTPILGHLNTESILFSVIDGAVLTFGSYENTRIFSIDKFIESDEERRAPKARIYLPGLLNWIQFDQAMQIREEESALWDAIYSATTHAEGVIAAASLAEPHFTQPGLYKHHFVCMSAQLKALSNLPVGKRIEAIRAMITTAMELDSKIEGMPLALDAHGRGEHLQPWLDALNRFYRRFLKH